MKRLLSVAIAATLMTAAAFVGIGFTTTDAHAAWRNNECRYQTFDGRKGWTNEEVIKTIRCAVKKKGLSVSKALMIASHESGFNESARNSSSGACGIFQHLPEYWPSRIRNTNAAYVKLRSFNNSCYNPRSNIFAAVKLAKSSGGWDAHWCRWASYC